MPRQQPVIDVQLTRHPVEMIPFDPFPPEAGGECAFLGRTRAETHPQHGRLTKLTYEAYEPMAMKSLENLARLATAQFGCLIVRIHHAVGEVPIGKASVLVQVACGHRAAAFDACRFLIDRLKSETPIWKQEIWADGTTWSKGVPVTSG